jgi:hypothetical protein
MVFQHRAFDGHTGKAGMASLVGAAQSAPQSSAKGKSKSISSWRR